VNAYVMPRVASYLEALQARLIDMGLKTRLLMLQSNGGAASLDQLIRQPVNLLLSGPSRVSVRCNTWLAASARTTSFRWK
jgi:N-methylhydantoinase A